MTFGLGKRRRYHLLLTLLSKLAKNSAVSGQQMATNENPYQNQSPCDDQTVANLDRCTASTEQLRDVSFVMPVQNEENFLVAAVESVLSQQTPGKSQIVLVLGQSSDRTDNIAARLAKKHSEITIVLSPTGSTPDSLNLGIAACKFDCIIRVDGHCSLPSGYASLAIEILNASKAANVGGKMAAKGRSNFQRAVALAYNNWFGLGGGKFHIGGTAGPAESVYLGCYNKKIMDSIGWFSKKYKRGQDWELNYRIRQAGHQVWFDPRLSVDYFPRENVRDLSRQFYSTGLWRGRLTIASPGRSNLRYWTPSLMVISTALLFPLLAYLVAILVIAVYQMRKQPRTGMWLFTILPVIHTTFGIGFLAGMLKQILFNNDEIHANE